MRRLPKKCTVFAEGKTKIIWLPVGEKVFGMVQNKSVVTAGDGKYCDEIPGKDVFVTSAACNIFELLNKRGIPTHYQRKTDDGMYYVRLLGMIPIEIVVRRIAYGSYLERNPHVAEGTKFTDPLTEFFYKNDVMSDPMMRWYPPYQCFRLYYSHEPPEKRGHIGELQASSSSDPCLPKGEGDMEQLQNLAVKCFLILEEAFKKIGITLVDFKIECGYGENRKLYVGDQIDGDACRLWVSGDKTKAVDKDRYRGIVKQGRTPTLKEKELISADYRHIAEMTASFRSF